MAGKHVKYLCAVLNAKLIRWSLQQVAQTSGMGVFQWKKVYVETIPIPLLSAAQQRPFIRLIDCILASKASNLRQNAVDREKEIDRFVYSLYDLTPTEIATVEKALK